MGYTHYWKLNTELDQEVVKIIDDNLFKYDNIIREESNNDRKALVSTNAILFNGIKEDSYETFAVVNNKSGFCKTARQPYDIAVCETLLILKGHYKDQFELDSDGFAVSKLEYDSNTIDENWNQALENVKKIGYDFKLEKEVSISGGNKYYEINITNK